MESYLIWYIVAGIMLLAEALTAGTFIFICFALSALLIGVIDQFSDLGIIYEVSAYFVITGIFLITIKPLLKSIIHIPKSEDTTYSKKLIGQEAMVFKPISRAQMGTVQLFEAGETWLAKSSDGNDIGQGSTVKIVSVEASILTVKAI